MQLTCNEKEFSLDLLLLLSLSVLCKLSYEIFLHIHQALAALSVYVIWQHLSLNFSFSRVYLYILAGIFPATLIWQCEIILYWSKRRQGACCQAYITQINETIKIKMIMSQPIKVKAEQYINMWISSVSFWFFVQSHLFVMMFLVKRNQKKLKLFIESCRDLTHELLLHEKIDMKSNRFHLALFSGLHGVSISVCKYENVLMVASDFSIAAELLYVKQLIHGYNNCKAHTHKVHLVWQLQSLG